MPVKTTRVESAKICGNKDGDDRHQWDVGSILFPRFFWKTNIQLASCTSHHNL